MNTDIIKKSKNDFEIFFFKLMNNAVFGKNYNGVLENVRKNRNIKLVTIERRRNCFLPEPNYHATKFFTENLLAIEIKKAEILTNKLVCLEFSILELNKILMYDFWYDYEKPKYDEKVKLCYMDLDSFLLYIKNDDIYIYGF